MFNYLTISILDIVYVGVQNIAHCSLVIQALNAGKHVLCEKPMGVNGREAREMIAVARRNKRFFMEATFCLNLISFFAIV